MSHEQVRRGLLGVLVVEPKGAKVRDAVAVANRQPGRDRLHFLQIALASLSEVGYCIHAARRLGYIDAAKYNELELDVRQTAAPLRGLMKSQGRERP